MSNDNRRKGENQNQMDIEIENQISVIKNLIVEPTQKQQVVACKRLTLKQIEYLQEELSLRENRDIDKLDQVLC